MLTLGSGSFKASGGQIVTVTVHLSSAARKLLSQSGSRGLKVRVTILARGVDGSAHTTTVLATLHVAKAAKHH